MTNPSIRILLADDHPIVRHGLALIIDNEPDMTVIGQVSTGKAAVEFYRQHQPDVALLDLQMPEMGAVDAIVAIREYDTNANLIILTTYDTDEDIYRGLRAGARSYLLKDTPVDEILDVVRAVHAGKKFIPTRVGMRLAERMDAQELSDRELEVLRLIAAGKSNLEIGIELGIAESTVKFHVNHVLEKLEVSDRTQAVIQAAKRGIVKL
ncbi:response regulator [Leptolyngbya sp. NIES-2104]|uniref:response regulator n=1 Tax=Leptolyngbya sp. NIES-2104 TaxID=1552121 RepID=UPI0006EC9779|nr:response regulator transcription factor [Leptolyngbya sp. NIES-2104]GAP98050.1 two-component response regulator [Leptolyngbya sp. NIES-2104]